MSEETTPTPPEELGFEQALEELEELTRKVESGQLPLEETLGAFERGMALATRCRDRLEEAEGRIRKLLPDGNTEDFETTD
jgi:exodeoxyribonuclease VII small subunit